MARPLLRPGAPAGFSLKALVWSHGWRSLAPFAFDQTSGTLRVVLRGVGRRPLEALLRQGPAGGLSARLSRTLGEAEKRACRVRLRRILDLDRDLSGFHAWCRKHPPLRWVARGGHGRFLRGEDAWEDLAKTLLTTNCAWAGTVGMVHRLVDLLGRPLRGSVRAFPRPEDVARMGAAWLRSHVRAGYRSESLLALAQEALTGSLGGLDDLDDEELRARLLGLRGFGPYAAEAYMLISGRAVAQVVDSWALALARCRHPRVKDARGLRAHYAAHGPYRGLVAWFDLMGEGPESF